jgi:hypothetical protein
MPGFDVGPVFWCEWRRASRERWFYAGRCFVVGGLLAGLAAVCWSASYRLDLRQSSTISMAREWCFKIIVLTQLSMLLLVAPASTAGAFSTEIARGHVFLMLVTGLTPAEIVCGTLFARLLPVLSSVACVVPVLVLSSQLAGISLLDLAHLEIVTTGAAVLGCTLALTLSIGARRLHETLMATYVILLGWVLGYPVLFMIGLTSVGYLIPGWLTRWSQDINPYWLLKEPGPIGGRYAWHEPWIFLAGTVALSIGLVALATWRLRPSALAVAEVAPSRRWLSRLVRNRPLVNLDSHPVFWRECRLQQPSRWIGLLWQSYVVGAVLFTSLAVWECTIKGPKPPVWAGLFNGFQAAVGLLLLSVVTPAALAEDRARGSLELLLSTPISTRSLVLSKWCAYYRAVPALAFLPAVVAIAHAFARDRWVGVALAAGMVLAQGAAITSLGIALATWVPRVDRALILSATMSVIVTVAWAPLAFLFFQGNSLSLGLASASPLLGVALLTTSMVQASNAEWSVRAGWAAFWIITFSAAAIGLLWAALASFDRCVGRIGPRAGAIRLQISRPARALRFTHRFRSSKSRPAL